METTVICIMPVKNESWILKETIAAAFTWADRIIVGDNKSKDDTVRIAREAGCDVVDVGIDYDEGQRRARLVAEARKISGRKLIVSVDADELLSPNCPNCSEWKMMRDAALGTRFTPDLIEFLPGLSGATLSRFPVTLAFVDDGSPFNDDSFIHSPRIPITSGPVVKLNEIKLLHCIAIDEGRLISKHRWYKCIEFIENGKRPWEICVKYQDVKLKIYDASPIPVDPAWIAPYRWLSKYHSLNATDSTYWWDEEVLNYFDRHGIEKFRKLNIWNTDWTRLSERLGRPSKYQDPRSVFEVVIHKFIERYREQLKLGRRHSFRTINSLARSFLRLFGW